MSPPDDRAPRGDTDESLQAERQNTDRELARRVTVADADADEVLRIARQRADRLLNAARAAADARLPLSEQTKAAVDLLLEKRAEEDRTVAAERERADELLDRERRERREKLLELLVVERQTTDLHLSLERRWADMEISSRDDFLGQASHDLGGLMAAHKMYLALLVREAGDGEHAGRLARPVATLLKIDAQMERLIADLVDIVAIDAGKLGVTLRPHSAVELVSTATAVFEPLAGERGQSLIVTDSPDVNVFVDPARAIQVLSNLLSNALKFTPRGGEIRVGLQVLNDEVEFFVADSGPGVSAERAEQIFERFVGSKGAGGGLGLGLGLFIARRLVEAHGGRLWLESEKDRGAVFRFTLKRAAV